MTEFFNVLNPNDAILKITSNKNFPKSKTEIIDTFSAHNMQLNLMMLVEFLIHHLIMWKS